MDDNTLKRIQSIECEILTVVHDFCIDNDIKYSLYAGTLLGAVRHNGFIPWDDDLDICMPRDEYERFIRLWSENPPYGYVLQNKENDSKFSQSFTKIRKDHTTFIQYEQEKGRYHTGIFVDIFPIDRIPKDRKEKSSFYRNCFIYQLMTRDFINRAGFGTKIIFSLIKLVPEGIRKYIRDKSFKRITKYNNNPHNDCVFIETTKTMKVSYPSTLLDEYVELNFEGRKFNAFKLYDDYLKIKYGNYMTPPPENERFWQHHPLIIDFDRNFDEIKEVQNAH